MNIGIIGTGNIGSNAARLFTVAGHKVAISNSRGPQTLKELSEELGDNATALPIEETIVFGDVILIAIPFGRYTELPVNVWDNKIVIDANNYYPERDGQFPELDNGSTTSSEMLEKHLGGARLVKGFNTIWFEHLKSQGDASLPTDKRRAVFIAGDDSEAKAIVAKLIEDIGFAAVDTGFLHDGGKKQQPGTEIYNITINARDAAAAIAAGV